MGIFYKILTCISIFLTFCEWKFLLFLRTFSDFFALYYAQICRKRIIPFHFGQLFLVAKYFFFFRRPPPVLFASSRAQFVHFSSNSPVLPSFLCGMTAKISFLSSYVFFPARRRRKMPPPSSRMEAAGFQVFQSGCRVPPQRSLSPGI
jgi:hypothetical protein